MFRTLRNMHKLSKMEAKWVSATGIDLRDSGQIVMKAGEYVNNLNLPPEDAWVISLINWMNGHPHAASKNMIAEGLTAFIGLHGQDLGLASDTVMSAVECAKAVKEE